MRILLVEDNQRLNGVLKLNLVEAGYAVDSVYDGQTAQDFAESTPYDAMVMDVMLPRKDGLQLCRELRSQRINTPILMLTARDTVADRVKGLDSGADDYLVKPFAMPELCARLRALLRRNAPDKTSLILIGDLAVEVATHEVTRQGQKIDLTAKEFAFLEYFIRHPNQVITRDMALNHIWSYDFEGVSNVVDVYIRRLRRKIDDPYEEKLFETVHGMGYRLRQPEIQPD